MSYSNGFDSGANGHKTAADYESMSHIEHILHRSNMYIGSIAPTPHEVDVYNPATQKIEKSTCNWSVGATQLFNEVLSNAVDNFTESSRNNYYNVEPDTPFIEIVMDQNVLSITNYGEPIPIEYKPENNMYVPEMIFGTLLTSSNYQHTKSGKIRHGAGQNGLGAKITNIFSQCFQVEVVDDIRNLYYLQNWTNNMTQTSGPCIQKLTVKARSMVKVTYQLDFRRLSYQEYPEEAYYIHMAIAASNSCTSKCIIKFNDVTFDKLTLAHYLSMVYPEEALATAVYHYLLEDETTQEIKKKKINGHLTPIPVYKDKKNKHPVRPLVEIALLDPVKAGYGNIFSYANSLRTLSGVHVDRVYDAFIRPILDYVNKGQRIDNVEAKNKGKAKGKEVKKTTVLTPSNVKNSIAFVASFHLEDVDFNSQAKTHLTEPRPAPIKPDPKLFSAIYKWDYMEYLRSTLRGMRRAELNQTDGKKTKRIKLTDKEYDAGWAGTKRSQEAILYIVEGDSASGYEFERRSMDPQGTDRSGILILQGVPPNASKCDIKKLLDSLQIISLKKMLGLQEGKDYTLPENRVSLRYGAIVLMTDADFDGTHIKALVYNYFNEFFPSIFQAGMIYDYRTKFLEARKGKAIINFYTEYQYEQWKLNTFNWKSYKFKFFKGLGTSERQDIAEDYKNPKIIRLFYDEMASNMFHLAFGKTNAGKRKIWIQEHCANGNSFGYEVDNILEISTFFRYEYMIFIIGSLVRGIPAAADSLKRSYRQIIYSAIKRWNVDHNKTYTRKNEVKVSQLSGYTSDTVDYHHGEDSLNGAIVTLASNYKGTNNFNLLYPCGQFGSVINGSKSAASPRYIHTYPMNYLGLIFRKEDEPILDYHYNGADRLEPKQFRPIVPINVINGSSGIAVGYRNLIPNHNPLEVVDRLLDMLDFVENYGLDKLNKFEPTPLVPWYKNFNGNICLYKSIDDTQDESESFLDEKISTKERELIEIEKIEVKNSYNQIVEKGENSNINIVEGSKRKINCVELYGNLTIDQNTGTITVTELPPGIWSKKYELWLIKKLEKKRINGYINKSSVYQDHFIIEGFKWKYNKEGQLEGNVYSQLNLVRKISLANLVFLDDENVPILYDDIESYLNDYFTARLIKYQDRKVYILADLEQRLKDTNNIIKLITAVIEGNLIIYKRPRQEIHSNMESLDIPKETLDKIKLKDLDADGLAKNYAKLEEDQNKYDNLKNKSLTSLWRSDLQELREILAKDPELHRTIAPTIIYPTKNEIVIEEDVEDSSENSQNACQDISQEDIIEFDLS